jgi:hypothetical protein
MRESEDAGCRVENEFHPKLGRRLNAILRTEIAVSGYDEKH